MADRRKIKGTNVSAKATAGPSSAAKRIKIKRNVREPENNSYQHSATSVLSPVEKALQNPLILQNIFKFVPYIDLKVCRSVDLPLWSSEAEHALRQHPLLNIALWTDSATMTKTLQGKTTTFEFESIPELSDHLEASEQGHEIWLDFHDVSPRTLRTFFKKFGKVICQLQLSHTASRALLQRMLSWLPALTYLHLKDVPSPWKSEKKIFKNLNLYSFPQIKTISFGSNDSFYPKLISSLCQMMPNLNSFFNFPINCIPDSDEDYNFQLDKIKSVNFSSSTLGNDQNEAELSNWATVSQHIRLKKTYLCIKTESEDGYESCCESLSSILQNNQNTLESLIIEPIALPEFLRYPEMKAVKKLCLYYPNLQHEDLKFFAESFDTEVVFPNLTEVSFNGFGSLEGFLKLFPEDAFTKAYFQGVLSLDLKFKKVQLEALEKIATLFPDVVNLSMNENIHWLKKGLRQISRSWPNLVSLELNLDVLATPIRHPYLLDSVFTGLSEEKCFGLRKHQDKRDINDKRNPENLGISRFADLQELTLNFGDYEESGRSCGDDRKHVPVFSHVAVLYGFQCLPNLKVTCAIPLDHLHKKRIIGMLNPIEKYVDFEPNYFNPSAFHEQLFL